MALLQIAEPGQSAAPHERKHAVGIDLGTTNSLVATVRGGRPEVLADAGGPRSLVQVAGLLGLKNKHDRIEAREIRVGPYLYAVETPCIHGLETLRHQRVGNAAARGRRARAE